jgi:hypothetical protein
MSLELDYLFLGPGPGEELPLFPLPEELLFLGAGAGIWICDSLGCALS